MSAPGETFKVVIEDDCADPSPYNKSPDCADPSPYNKSLDGETFKVVIEDDCADPSPYVDFIPLPLAITVPITEQKLAKVREYCKLYKASLTGDKASEDSLKAFDADGDFFKAAQSAVPGCIMCSTLQRSELPPPERRQKVNEEENNAKKTIDPQIDGFNVDEYPHQWLGFRIVPMFNLSEGSGTHKMLKGYAERALNKFNARESTNWVIDKVLKANEGGCRDYHYYITCSVKTSKGEKSFFQVEVVCNIDTREKEFPIIRLKAEKDNGIKCLKSAPGPSSLELSGDESRVSVPIDLPCSPTKQKMAWPFPTDLQAEAGRRWMERNLKPSVN